MYLAYLPFFSLNGMKYFLSWLRNEKIHQFEGKLRINSFIPPWPSVAQKRLLHAATSKHRIPFQVYYAVTGKCPCTCSHCSYAQRNIEKKNELTKDESLELINQIKHLGCSLIGFTGGEPLLRNDLETLIASCKPELATILFTTGHGLTKQRAELLKKADLDWFTVGIESADEKRHDKIRNHPGSFQKAIRALQLADESGLYTAISTVASKSKVRNGEIRQLYDFAVDHNVSEFRIIPYVACGGGVGNTCEMLEPQDYEYLTMFHKSLNKQKKGPVIESFSYIESAELYGCGAGYHHFFVDATGNVCPCDLTPLSFGTVKDESLHQIWERMESYFPRPRKYCIMQKIAPRLSETNSRPIPFDESTRLIPKLTKKDKWPKMYTFLKRGK